MTVLKARIAGAWVQIPVGADEVYVGPSAPVDSATELWYDTSATPTPSHAAINLTAYTLTTSMADWPGGPLIVPTPANVACSFLVRFTASGSNFSNASAVVANYRLGVSFDGGVNYTFPITIETLPFGQTGAPIINRMAMATQRQFSGTPTVASIYIKVQAQDGHTGGTNADGACLSFDRIS